MTLIPQTGNGNFVLQVTERTGGANTEFDSDAAAGQMTLTP